MENIFHVKMDFTTLLRMGKYFFWKIHMKFWLYWIKFRRFQLHEVCRFDSKLKTCARLSGNRSRCSFSGGKTPQSPLKEGKELKNTNFTKIFSDFLIKIQLFQVYQLKLCFKSLFNREFSKKSTDYKETTSALPSLHFQIFN